MIGRTLRSYRILESLGAGGMGEVYRAVDERLGRQVALKVLLPRFAGDPGRLARFEREARAVAALEHPNIVTIYSIEEAEGVLFFTMQLVEGETLATHIPHDGMPLDRFFEIAIPLADAVSAAHHHGVIHRDLKPGNVLISRDGEVKVLDFGLAKLRDEEAAWPAVGDGRSRATTVLQPQALTAAEGVLGTAAYMSPEQAEGHAVDERSDIFSLAVILYEMATGKHPFRGASRASTISSILRDTPSRVGEIKPDLPRHLGRIIKHGLEKEVQRRYQAALDLRNDLVELREEIDSGEMEAGAAAVARRRTRRWGRSQAARLALAGAALVFATAVGIWLVPARRQTAEPPTVVPLTSWEGSERQPALSPSGEQLAFVWDSEIRGRFDLHVMLPGAGAPLRLTTGPGSALHPAWSPDGREIAYLEERSRDRFAVAVVPALGGRPRLLGEAAAAGFPGLDWSPDGDWLAVVDHGADAFAERVVLLSTTTGEKRRLTEPPSSGVGDRNPVFSPDGKSLAFVRWYEGPRNDLYIAALAGTPARLVTRHEGWIRGLDWMPDGSALVFAAKGLRTSGLYRVSRRGETSRLAFGQDAGELTIAPAGGRLVFAELAPDSNIWRVPGPAAGGAAAGSRLIGSTRDDWAPRYSPDGSRIAFTSDRTGDPQIFVSDSQGRNSRQMTSAREAASIMPYWSPDGESIAFARAASGNLDVYVMEVRGGFARRLTSSAGVDGASAWSADGRWIYFFSDRTGSYQIWKLPAAGGEPVQITREGGLLPRLSSDGERLYYLKESHPFSIWEVPVDGGEERPVLEREGLWESGFDVWGESLVYLQDGGEDGARLERYDLASGRIETLLDQGPEIRPGKYGRISVSPDGRWILYPRDDSRGSDLILVEGFRG